MLEVIDGVPGLGERVRAAERVERLYGATQLPNFVRKAYGPGWALVGDAGCHKDPFLALGVCDAFRDAELLADALPRASAARPLEDALAVYERRRDAATLQDFDANFMAAHLVAPPELLAARRRCAATRRPRTASTCVREGMVPA